MKLRWMAPCRNRNRPRRSWANHRMISSGTSHDRIVRRVADPSVGGGHRATDRPRRAVHRRACHDRRLEAAVADADCTSAASTTRSTSRPQSSAQSRMTLSSVDDRPPPTYADTLPQQRLQPLGRRPARVAASKSQVAFHRRRGFAYMWMPGMYLRKPAADVVLSIASTGRSTRSGSRIVHPLPRIWMHPRDPVAR